MGRNVLPEIAVKEELALRRVRLPRQLDTEIIAFAQFYGAQTGGAVPDENAVIVGILRDYLSSNAAFQRYRKEEGKPVRRTGQAATRDKPAPEIAAAAAIPVTTAAKG